MNPEASPPYHASPELRHLVDGALAGTLDRPALARLEQHLEADPGALEWYLAMAEMEALLPLAAKNVAAQSVASPVIQSIPVPFLARWQPWLLAAAAVVVASLLAWQWQADAARKTGPFATVTASIGVRWTEQGKGPALHAVLRHQKIEPATGLVEITHASGARVLIEGPASYTVLGPNAGKLDFGRLVAAVPPGAEGFNVDTGGEKVVDHGTEFAIARPRGGQPEVGVFRGEAAPALPTLKITRMSGSAGALSALVDDTWVRRGDVVAGYRVTALRTESIELVNLAESTQRLTLRLNPVVVDRADVNKDVNRDATRNSTRAATQPATAWPSLALEK